MHLYEKELFTENSYLHIYGYASLFNLQELPFKMCFVRLEFVFHPFILVLYGAVTTTEITSFAIGIVQNHHHHPVPTIPSSK
jgi:hypothetical protein